MANSLSSYEPTPAHRALAAEGLTLLDQETLASFAARVGWRMDAETFDAFLARRRRDRADAGAAFRQDGAAHVEAHARSVGEPSRPDDDDEEERDAASARKSVIKKKIGAETLASEEDAEPNAAAAQAAMIEAKKNGWRKPRKDRGHLAATGREATEQHKAASEGTLGEPEEGQEEDAAKAKAASDAKKRDAWKAKR
jgi:hypothetical protein